MARLVVQHPDGTPYGRARRPEARVEQNVVVTNAKGVDLVGVGAPAETWMLKPGEPVDPDADVETVEVTERMWWRATNRLAYRAGQSVPVEELPLLVGDSERSGEVTNDPRNAKRRHRR